MIKITSVLFSLWIFSLFAPQASAGDSTATYQQCLKLEREILENNVKESCGQEGDNDPDSSAKSFAACLEKSKTMQLSEIANQKCHDKAMTASDRPIEAPAFGGRRTPVNDTLFSPVHVRPPSAADPSPAKTRVKKKVPDPRQTDEDLDKKETTAEKPKSRATGPTDPTSPGFESSIDAEIQASQDIARCSTAASSANECCTNPLACSDQLSRSDSNSLGALGAMVGGGAQGGGIGDYCRQMNTLSGNSGNVNIGLASICFGSHATCSTTCGGLADKYANLLAECDGCEEQSVYENAQRSLTTRKYTCSNLRTRSDQLAITGLGTANNQAVADHCKEMAGTGDSPESALATASPSSPYINHLLAYNCNANPNGPECKGMDVRAAAPRGQSGFDQQQKKNTAFNIPDPSSGFNGYEGNRAPGTQSSEAGRSGNTPKVGTVANNSGGPVGGGSGSLSPATLSPKSKTGPAPSGLNTEVDQGFQGGNGYSQTVAAQNNEDSSSYGGGRHLPTTDKQFENLDLRQFLPGGSRAALRRLAGIGEINPKEENIFLRISNKMMEKCRLGVLWQCR